MQQYFTAENGVLIFRRRYETIRIEGWGANSLRVRTTENQGFTPEDWALTEEVSHEAKSWVEVRPTNYGFDQTVGVIENGNIRAEISDGGRIRFLNEKGQILLKEYYMAMGYGKDFDGIPDWIATRQHARQFRNVVGDNYKVSLSFWADDEE